MTMNTRPLTLIGMLFVIVAGATAQKAGQTTSAGREYRLQALYRAGVAQSYTITENTVATRTHSDSSTKTYSRDVTYYTTIRCIESNEGQATIVVNLDSLTYRFSSTDKTVEYDSQKDITPKNFADLNNYIGPLNRPFEMSVTPYGEVTTLKGEQVEFWRDYLTENKNDLDSVIYMIWMQSLDRENLLQYGDLQKRTIPGRRFAVDSSWKHRMQLRLDGVVFADTVSTTFKEYSGGLYKIVCTDTMSAAPQPIHVYGIPYISNLQEGKAVLDHTVELSSTGTINEVTSKVASWFRASVLNEIFTQNVTTTTSWKLTGQFQW
jgi:Family of unknown function (DUF6263)